MSKSILSQSRRDCQGKRQHDERQEVSRIARMDRITRMETWGKLVDCTKQLASGISGIRVFVSFVIKAVLDDLGIAIPWRLE